MLKIHHTFQFPTCTKHVVRVVVPFRHPGAVLCCFLKILCAQQLVERRWRLLARHGQRRDVDSVEAFQSNCWRMPAMCCIVKAVAQGERKKRDTVISCCLFAKGTCCDESDLRLFLLKHIVKNERSHQLRLTERSHALRITSKMCVCWRIWTWENLSQTRFSGGKFEEKTSVTKHGPYQFDLLSHLLLGLEFSILKNKESSSSTPSTKPETQRTRNSTNENLQGTLANSGKFPSLQRHTVHLSKWSTLIAQITLDVLRDVYFLWGAPWPTRFPLDCHMD